MHSSRMHTACSSSCWGEPGQFPLNFPLGCGSGPDLPQLPPWVWAWTRSPSTSPLGVGLDQIHLNFPLGCGPGPDPPVTSPLVVGLDQTSRTCAHTPLGCGPPDQAPSRTRPPDQVHHLLGPRTPLTRHPPRPHTPPCTEFLTHASETRMHSSRMRTTRSLTDRIS